MKPFQHVVIYKDSAKARNKYYGPFVSESMAEQFMDALPIPLEGGAKTYKFISPYTFEESDLAFTAIVRERDKDHPVNRILADYIPYTLSRDGS